MRKASRFDDDVTLRCSDINKSSGDSAAVRPASGQASAASAGPRQTKPQGAKPKKKKKGNKW